MGADISYLRSWEGFVYLAVMVDAFNREVVGWAIADHLRTELVIDAVQAAVNSRPRKVLDWKTPAEALDEQLRLLHQAGVATTG